MKYIRILVWGLVSAILATILSFVPFIRHIMHIFLPIVPVWLYLFVFICCILLIINSVLFHYKNIWLLIIIYSILIILTIYVRHPYTKLTVNQEFYLIQWIKDGFKNHIILVNIVVNLLLFMPLGYILKKLIFQPNWLLCLIGSGIVTGLELIQFITKTGVLDVLDIILNASGVIIIILLFKERSEVIHE